nr:putative nuclease HARBI1 [Onthophagus taurus]
MPLIYGENENQSRRGLPIPPVMKICVALRFYATGSIQVVCGDLVNISQPTCSRIISEVSELLARKVPQYMKFPSTAAEVARHNRKFFLLGGFPGVNGCIDGTHIKNKSPGGQNAEVFRNRKGWMSLNVQVVSDADLRIQDIVVRWPGSTHDSRMFANSAIKMKLERGEVSGIILGHSAYQQTDYLFTPVLNPQTRSERRYNRAHVTTRNSIERTFGLWKSTFRCLQSTLQHKLRNSIRIIIATAVLHNIKRSRQIQHQTGNEQNMEEIQIHNLRGRAAFIEHNFN